MKIQVYDPPMCCSTGVCGPSVDPALVRFAADLDWLKRQGVSVERYNLSQQPAAFVENPVVKQALAKEGNDCLPLTLADGAVVLKGRYPTREMLAEYAGLQTVRSLITDATRALLTVSAAIGSGGEDSLRHSLDEARHLGISPEDLRQAVDIAQSVKDRAALSTWELAQRCLGPTDEENPGAGCCETSQPSSTKTLEIKWQRLVSEGQTCPRCGSTEEELEKAISALRQSLAPLGIGVALEKGSLTEAEFRKDPLQSNRIWFNDRRLEDWVGGQVGHSPCCDVCGPEECRTVGVGGEVYEAIPADLIIRVGLLAAAQLIGARTGQSYCQGEGPAASGGGCCS